jgi:hypothetical protein
MLNRKITACLLVLAFQAPALATKYHFADEKESKDTVGNAEGRFVQGVLLKEDKTTYTIRVVGGEITITKASVKRIENDGMTVAMIDTVESDRAAAVAATETQRREVRAAEASSQRGADNAEPQPESSERSLVIEVDFQDILPGYTFRTFDPVLGRANIAGLRQVIEEFLRTEVRKAARRK